MLHGAAQLQPPTALAVAGPTCSVCRPDGKQWLKFDDERVEKADDQKAVEDNWGGEDERPPGGEEGVTSRDALLASRSLAAGLGLAAMLAAGGKLPVMQPPALSACAGMHAHPTPRLPVWLARPHMVSASVPLC